MRPIQILDSFLLPLVALTALLAPSSDLGAQPLEGKHVTLELIAASTAIVPGKPIEIGVRFDVEREWHIYWRNPGDAGDATSIEWNLPEGFTIGEIRWPYPHAFDDPPEVSYGYESQVLLVAELLPPASLAPGDSIRIEAGVSWMACKDLCIPGKGNLSLALPVAGGSAARASEWSTLFEQARLLVPRPPHDLAIVAREVDSSFAIDVTSLGASPHLPGSVYFFARDEAVIDHSGEQPLSRKGNALTILLSRSPFAQQRPERIRGVLVAESGWDREGEVKAIEIDLPIVRFRSN